MQGTLKTKYCHASDNVSVAKDGICFAKEQQTHKVFLS
jgi:hypothetical protein